MPSTNDITNGNNVDVTVRIGLDDNFSEPLAVAEARMTDFAAKAASLSAQTAQGPSASQAAIAAIQENARSRLDRMLSEIEPVAQNNAAVLGLNFGPNDRAGPAPRASRDDGGLATATTADAQAASLAEGSWTKLVAKLDPEKFTATAKANDELTKSLRAMESAANKAEAALYDPKVTVGVEQVQQAIRVFDALDEKFRAATAKVVALKLQTNPAYATPLPAELPPGQPVPEFDPLRLRALAPNALLGGQLINDLTRQPGGAGQGALDPISLSRFGSQEAVLRRLQAQQASGVAASSQNAVNAQLGAFGIGPPRPPSGGDVGSGGPPDDGSGSGRMLSGSLDQITRLVGKYDEVYAAEQKMRGAQVELNTLLNLGFLDGQRAGDALIKAYDGAIGAAQRYEERQRAISASIAAFQAEAAQSSTSAAAIAETQRKALLAARGQQVTPSSSGQQPLIVNSEASNQAIAIVERAEAEQKRLGSELSKNEISARSFGEGMVASERQAQAATAELNEALHNQGGTIAARYDTGVVAAQRFKAIQADIVVLLNEGNAAAAKAGQALGNAYFDAAQQARKLQEAQDAVKASVARFDDQARQPGTVAASVAQAQQQALSLSPQQTVVPGLNADQRARAVAPVRDLAAAEALANTQLAEAGQTTEALAIHTEALSAAQIRAKESTALITVELEKENAATTAAGERLAAKYDTAAAAAQRLKATLTELYGAEQSGLSAQQVGEALANVYAEEEVRVRKLTEAQAELNASRARSEQPGTAEHAVQRAQQQGPEEDSVVSLVAEFAAPKGESLEPFEANAETFRKEPRLSADQVAQAQEINDLKEAVVARFNANDQITPEARGAGIRAANDTADRQSAALAAKIGAEADAEAAAQAKAATEAKAQLAAEINVVEEAEAKLAARQRELTELFKAGEISESGAAASLVPYQIGLDKARASVERINAAHTAYVAALNATDAKLQAGAISPETHATDTNAALTQFQRAVTAPTQDTGETAYQARLQSLDKVAQAQKNLAEATDFATKARERGDLGASQGAAEQARYQQALDNATATQLKQNEAYDKYQAAQKRVEDRLASGKIVESEANTQKKAALETYQSTIVALDKTGASGFGAAFAIGQVSREVVVLGHEIIQGNFSRLAGSLIVITEYLGAFREALVDIGHKLLTTAVGLTSLGAIAVVGTLTAITVAAQHLSSQLVDLSTQSRATRSDFNQAAVDVQGANRELLHGADSIDIIEKNQSIQPSAGTAAGITTSKRLSVSSAELTPALAAIRNAPEFEGGKTELEDLGRVANNLAVVFQITLPEAGKKLAQSIRDPAAAAAELAKQGFPGVNDALAKQIEFMQKAGNQTEAYTTLIDHMRPALAGASEAHTPLGQAMVRLGKAFEEADSKGRTFGEGLGKFVLSVITAAVNKLASFAEYLNELDKKNAGGSSGSLSVVGKSLLSGVTSVGSESFDSGRGIVVQGIAGRLAQEFPALFQPARPGSEVLVSTSGKEGQSQDTLGRGIGQVTPQTAREFGVNTAFIDANAGQNLIIAVARLVQAAEKPGATERSIVAEYGGFGKSPESQQALTERVAGLQSVSTAFLPTDVKNLVASLLGELGRSDLTRLMLSLIPGESGGMQFKGQQIAPGVQPGTQREGFVKDAGGVSSEPQAGAARSDAQKQYDELVNRTGQFAGNPTETQRRLAAQINDLEAGKAAAGVAKYSLEWVLLDERLKNAQKDLIATLTPFQSLERAALEQAVIDSAGYSAATKYAEARNKVTQAAHDSGANEATSSEIARQYTLTQQHLTAEFENYVNSIDTATSRQDKLNAGVLSAIEGGRSYAVAVQHQIDLAEAIKRTDDYSIRGTAERTRQVQLLTNSLDAQAAREKAGQLNPEIAAQEEQIRLTQAQISVVGLSADAQARYLAVYSARAKLTHDGISEETQQGQIYVANADALAKLAEKENFYKQSLSDVASALTSSFDALGQAISNAFVSGQGSAVNFHNAIKSLLGTLATKAAELAFINPITNALGLGPTKGTLYGALEASAQKPQPQAAVAGEDRIAAIRAADQQQAVQENTAALARLTAALQGASGANGGADLVNPDGSLVTPPKPPRAAVTANPPSAGAAEEQPASPKAERAVAPVPVVVTNPPGGEAAPAAAAVPEDQYPRRLSTENEGGAPANIDRNGLTSGGALPSPTSNQPVLERAAVQVERPVAPVPVVVTSPAEATLPTAAERTAVPVPVVVTSPPGAASAPRYTPNQLGIDPASYEGGNATPAARDESYYVRGHYGGFQPVGSPDEEYTQRQLGLRKSDTERFLLLNTGDQESDAWQYPMRDTAQRRRIFTKAGFDTTLKQGQTDADVMLQGVEARAKLEEADLADRAKQYEEMTAATAKLRQPVSLDQLHTGQAYIDQYGPPPIPGAPPRNIDRNGLIQDTAPIPASAVPPSSFDQATTDQDLRENTLALQGVASDLSKAQPDQFLKIQSPQSEAITGAYTISTPDTMISINTSGGAPSITPGGSVPITPEAAGITPGASGSILNVRGVTGVGSTIAGGLGSGAASTSESVSASGFDQPLNGTSANLVFTPGRSGLVDNGAFDTSGSGGGGEIVLVQGGSIPQGGAVDLGTGSQPIPIAAAGQGSSTGGSSVGSVFGNVANLAGSVQRAATSTSALGELSNIASVVSSADKVVNLFGTSSSSGGGSFLSALNPFSGGGGGGGSGGGIFSSDGSIGSLFHGDGFFGNSGPIGQFLNQPLFGAGVAADFGGSLPSIAATAADLTPAGAGLGAFDAAGTGAAQAGAASFGTVGSALGAAGLGFSLGSLGGGFIQSALGKTGPGPEIGAGVGTAVGAAIGAALAPETFGLSLIIGGLIGGAGGGLIGPKPPSPFSSTYVGVTDAGQLDLGASVSQMRNTDADRAAANVAIQATNAVLTNNALAITDVLGVNGANRALNVNQGDKTSFQIGENSPNGPVDPSKFADFATAFASFRFAPTAPGVTSQFFEGHVFASPEELDKVTQSLNTFVAALKDTPAADHTGAFLSQVAPMANADIPGRLSEIQTFVTQTVPQLTNTGSLSQSITGLNSQYKAAIDLAHQLGYAEQQLSDSRDAAIAKVNDTAAFNLSQSEIGQNVRFSTAYDTVNTTPGTTEAVNAQKATALYNFDNATAAQARKQLSDSLTATYGDAYKQTAGFAGEMALLEKTLGEERLAVAKSFDDQIAQQNKSAQGSVLSVANGLSDYARGLESSVLSPTQRYTLSKGEFDTQSAKAQGGDFTAIQTLTNYASNFVSSSKEVFGSGSQFFSNVQSVLDVINSLANTPVQTLTSYAFQQIQQQLMLDQTDTLMGGLTSLQGVLSQILSALQISPLRPSRLTP